MSEDGAAIPSIRESLANAFERVSASRVAAVADMDSRTEGLSFRNNLEDDAEHDEGLAEHLKTRRALERARDKVRTADQAKGEKPDRSWSSEVKNGAKGLAKAEGAGEAEANRKDTVKKAFDKANEKGGKGKLSDKDFNSENAVKARRELFARYPSQKPAEVLARFKQWEQELRKDPIGARDRILEAYLKYSPENYDKAAPKLFEVGEIDNTAKGQQRDIKRALENSKDKTELKEFIDEYGALTPRLLEQINEFDKALIADPVGASARLAATYGAPATPQQHEKAAEHYQQMAQREQFQANMNKALGMIIEHGMMPGMEDEKLQNRIADILESEAFQRTGDNFADLKTAWQLAKLQAEQEDNAAKKAKAGKSITGGPSTGGKAAPKVDEGARGSVRKALATANRNI